MVEMKVMNYERQKESKTKLDCRSSGSEQHRGGDEGQPGGVGGAYLALPGLPAVLVV